MDKCRIFPTGGYEGSPPPTPPTKNLLIPYQEKFPPVDTLSPTKV